MISFWVSKPPAHAPEIRSGGERIGATPYDEIGFLEDIASVVHIAQRFDEVTEQAILTIGEIADELEIGAEHISDSRE